MMHSLLSTYTSLELRGGDRGTTPYAKVWGWGRGCTCKMHGKMALVTRASTDVGAARRPRTFELRGVLVSSTAMAVGTLDRTLLFGRQRRTAQWGAVGRSSTRGGAEPAWRHRLWKADEGSGGVAPGMREPVSLHVPTSNASLWTVPACASPDTKSRTV